MRFLLLTVLVSYTAVSWAATGGPDQYGYTWIDSNEPGGPVFNWIDATINGTQVIGLADDNVVGPFVMQTNFPFYWYAKKNLYIGSNGYISFENGNIAATFPTIPGVGGTNDYMAALMTDLNFAGAGNPAQCWVLDSADLTVVSYIDVPFWSPNTGTGYDGSNTFQIVLNRSDSTITYQYLDQQSVTFSNTIIGIESVAGSIGLQHSDSLQNNGYAIRFINPANPLIQVSDAQIGWLSDAVNGGQMMARSGAPFEMVLNVENAGSQPLTNFELVGQIQNFGSQTLVQDTQQVNLLPFSTDTTVYFGNTFSPTLNGTYRYIGRVINVANELVVTNNIQEQELVVYDSNQFSNDLHWHGNTDDGIGLGWNGGGGGIGVYIDVPYHPVFVTSTLVRVASNLGGVGMYMKVWDDDGPNGSRGTLLDSVFYDGIQTSLGDNVVPLNTPFLLNDGGLYVSWEMEGPNINIARDIIPPFSRRTYEVLGGVWADYREKETEDFHLGLRVTLQPISDGGCTAFFGLTPGQQVSQPTPVRTWVKNFGNIPMSGFDVKYQFESEPVVSQAYSGTLQPGDSILFIFNQQLDPTVTLSGDLCTWTELGGDADMSNDTVCVNVNMIVGVNDLVPEQWLVSPVPTDDVLTIMPGNQQTYGIRLFSMNGKLIAWKDGLTGTTDLSTVGLPTGMYELRIEQNGWAIHKRLAVR